MKSRFIVALELALVALGAGCEGEPPKAPEMSAGGGDQAPSATEAEQTNDTPPTATATATAPTPTVTASATAAAGDGGAPAVVTTTADAAAPVVVAAVAHGEIVGKITATPAYLQSVAAVWLEDAPKEPGRGMTARIDNHQMLFTPMVTVITAGGAVTFNNTDPFPHNVFSPDGKFNMGTIPQNGSAAPKRFDKPGTFTLLCNLHPNMVAYLVVSPSSYYAKTDANGRFRIKDVPPGTYKITAWAPRLATVTESVTLSGAQATADFELHR